jgi:hypothetical protein
LYPKDKYLVHRFHIIRLWALISLCFGFTGGVQASESVSTDRKIVVVVSSQKLLAMEGPKIVYTFDVVTGRPGKEAEPGEYRIFRKVKDYHSRTYDSPMPYSMYFSEDGKAIHGTYLATLRSYLHAYLTESVGSMGCVGLTDEDAATP